MRMYNLHIAPIATRGQKSIGKYIAVDFGNPAAAKRLLTKIAKAIRSLETMPGKGAPLSSVIAVETDFRFIVTGNYLTFYRVEGDDVFVERVLYGKRDYTKILFPTHESGDGLETEE